MRPRHPVVPGRRVATLQFQIKGRDAAWPVGTDFRLPFPVRTLRYAERQPTPLLAIARPVREPVPTFGFLWLQEYIDVVLDGSPEWRSQQTVTLKIPPDNRIPGATDHLEFIADYPRRLRALVVLAGIAHELRYLAHDIMLGYSPNLPRVAEHLGKARIAVDELEATAPERETVARAQEALDLLIRGGPYTSADVQRLGWSGNTDDPDTNEHTVRSHLQTSQGQIEAMIATRTSVPIRRAVWEIEGDHLF